MGRPDKNRGHRIIFDVREVNKYVKSPVSTYTDCVTTPLKTPNSFFKAWFDDLSIVTKGDEDLHKKHLEIFLYKIHRLELKINLEKSDFFIKVQSDNFKLLEFEVEKGKIIPKKAKLNVLKDFKTPKNTQDVQKFIVFLEYRIL